MLVLRVVSLPIQNHHHCFTENSKQTLDMRIANKCEKFHLCTALFPLPDPGSAHVCFLLSPIKKTDYTYTWAGWKWNLTKYTTTPAWSGEFLLLTKLRQREFTPHFCLALWYCAYQTGLDLAEMERAICCLLAILLYGLAQFSQRTSHSVASWMFSGRYFA